MPHARPDTAQTAIHYPILVGALILSMGLAAMDSTIVSTALPTIVSHLGGFSSFSWVFSLYLLTQTVTVPIYGRLADVYGRRPVLLLGIGLFLVGSALSGTSTTMTQLIVYRGLQGVGAGAVMPITSTIIGDIYTLEQRARMQGVFSSVWGIAAILGPTLGGFLVQSFSWRLIFYINVPLGLLSVAGLLIGYRERVAHHGHRIDYTGAALLLAGVSALLLWTLGGGLSWPWGGKASMILAVAAVGLLVAMVRVEQTTPEPVLPFGVLGQRLIAVGDLGTLFAGGVTIGLSSYLPTYLQGAMGRSPTTAGLVLAAMSIGWPLSSALAGRILLRAGVRFAAVLGGVLAAAGSALLLALSPSASLELPAVASFVVGAGMGLISTTTLVAIQDQVPWQRRGIATSTNLFARQLGSTVFVGLFGAILNGSLVRALAGRHPSRQAAQRALARINPLLSASGRAHLAPAAAHTLIWALDHALHHVYVVSAVLALVALGILLLLPGGPVRSAREPTDTRQ